VIARLKFEGAWEILEGPRKYLKIERKSADLVRRKTNIMQGRVRAGNLSLASLLHYDGPLRGTIYSRTVLDNQIHKPI
jgi:cytoskeletal protein CcmA (bactofilin family)